MKARKSARWVGWFVLLGLLTSIFQIAELGLHTFWTEIVDDWLTSMSKILEHLAIAVCLWILFRQENFSSAKM
jgi:hypothetical protein